MRENLLQNNTPFGTFFFTPKNKLEELIIQDPEWQEGIFFGKPRRGHPEGMVWLHIQEVLDNIENLDVLISQNTKDHLRFITLIHDTFKYQVNSKLPTTLRTNHHAFLARQFAEKYCNDSKILDIIEYHDEAYYAWRTGGWHGKWDDAAKRMNQLIAKIGNAMPLYFLFFKCDTQTGDKDQRPMLWVEEQLQGRLNLVEY